RGRTPTLAPLSARADRCGLFGPAVRRAVGQYTLVRVGRPIHRPGRTRGTVAVAGHGHRGHRGVTVVRGPAGMAVGPHGVSRPSRDPGPGDRSPGHPPGGRRCGAPVRLGAQRSARTTPRYL